MNSKVKIEVKRLLSRNKIKEIFDLISELPESDFSSVQDDFLLLSAKFHALREKERINTISFYEANLEISKIRKAIIDLVNELNEVINNTNDNRIVQVDVPQLVEEDENELDENEELGYLDYLIMYQEGSEKMNNAMTLMSSYLAETSENMRFRTDELNRINKSNQKNKLILSKKVAGKLASELISSVDKINEEIDVFELTSTNTIESVYNAIRIAYDSGVKMNEDQLIKLKGSIEMYFSAISDAKDSVLSSREAYMNWPKATSEINKAQKETIKMHDRLEKEFSKCMKILAGLINNIDFTIKEINSSVRL